MYSACSLCQSLNKHWDYGNGNGTSFIVRKQNKISYLTEMLTLFNLSNYFTGNRCNITINTRTPPNEKKTKRNC